MKCNLLLWGRCLRDQFLVALCSQMCLSGFEFRLSRTGKFKKSSCTFKREGLLPSGVNGRVNKSLCNPLADLGACRAHAPLQDPSLSFSHTFSPKSARIGGPHPPPNGSTRPLTGPRPQYGKSWIRHCNLHEFKMLPTLIFFVELIPLQQN